MHCNKAASVLEVLHQAADAVVARLAALADWGPAGTRPGQYRSDLVADEAATTVLRRARLSIFSEESGRHLVEGTLTVVVDPLDGSTNASRGLPWYATSLCALDGDGPLAAVVANLASGARYQAVRAGGAARDGKPISPSRCRSFRSAVVGLNGYPARHLGWHQYRAMGAAALDLCAVAEGGLDAYLDCSGTLAPWDYLGGWLVCAESGASVASLPGDFLDAVAAGPRPIAAATPELLGEAWRLMGRPEPGARTSK